MTWLPTFKGFYEMNSNVFVIGLGGVTCGGKSTIADRLKNEFAKSNDINLITIKQDDYYLDEHLLNYLPEVKHYDWDTPTAVNFEKIIKLVRNIAAQCQKEANQRTIILVDGNMIFCSEKLSPLFQKRFFFTSSFERCKSVRETRTYEPPDVPGFFEKVCWPAYLKHEAEARNRQEEFEFLDSAEYQSNYKIVEMNLRKWCSKRWLLLTSEKLQIENALEFVTAPSNGAIASFIGTTRDTFENKPVVSLIYECYEEMAYKEMDKVCHSMRTAWPEIDRVVIFHRLGLVPVTETSVIVAVSSPHRKESFRACEYAIEALKQSVPIWKKEVYKDGSSDWKENQKV